MGKSAPKAPTPPDPVATAQAQGQMNEATARTQNRMNRVNQQTPYGNLEYNEMGGDRWSATQTLDPSQQRQLDLSNQASETYGRAAATQLGQVEGQMSRPFDPNLPGIRMDVADRAGWVMNNLENYSPGIRTNIQDRSGNLQGRADYSGIGDPNQSRDRVEASLNERQAPLQERDRAQLDSRLVNQGLQPGTQAYTAAMGDHYRGVNDARLATIGAAGQEQSRMVGLGLQQAAFSNSVQGQAGGLEQDAASFTNAAMGQLSDMDASRQAFRNQSLSQQTNMDLARGGFYNQARGQSLAEQLQMRNQPINEASALLTGNMIQNPNFVNVPGAEVRPTDYGNIVQNSANMRQRQYEQQVARQGSTMGSIAGLAGTAAGAAFGSPWVGGMMGGMFGGAAGGGFKK